MLLSNDAVMAITALIALPIGWIAADGISKGRFRCCVCANLYIFAVIEAFGILESLTYVLQNWSFTGRYTFDVNGIAYSDYLVIVGGTILFEIVYVVLCVALAKSTKTESQKTSGPVAGVKETEQIQDGFDVTGNEMPNTEVQTMEKLPKQRYCKYCGGAIDGNTKKCTKCGKQYFRIKSTKHIICYTLLIATILSLVYVIHIRELQHAEAYSKLNEEKENLSVIIKNKDIEIDSLETVASQLRSALSSARIQISFFDKHVVFVSDDGTRLYHKYECDDFDTSHFWAYNTEAAIDKGYKQCPECH